MKLRVRNDMFSIRLKIRAIEKIFYVRFGTSIQKRGNATPHVPELVVSSVWVVAIYTSLLDISVRLLKWAHGFRVFDRPV